MLDFVTLGLGAAALILLVMLLRQMTKQSTLAAELAAERVSAARVPELEAALGALQADKDREVEARVAAENKLAALEQGHKARLEDLKATQAEMEARFTALAGTALKGNSESFLNLVSERFKQHQQTAGADLSKRHEAIANLVKPLDEKLGQFDTRIKDIEKARGEAYGAIKAQVAQLAEGQKSLGDETRRLVQALRAPKTRGRWGEMQLRQVFEMAGMTEHVDFHLEQSVQTDEGLKRPDAVVHIPGGKNVVIDAKTPLEAYLDALESADPTVQSERIAHHAAQVRQHVKLLASKDYQKDIQSTPDFVVMFVPGETFVSAAAEVDPHLIEYAFEHKVLIATPTTLMALVKAIAYGWQQEKMAENAVEVQKLAKELYDRLSTFSENLGKVGRSLGQAVNNYNAAVGSMERRVLPSARKFEAMGVVAAQTEIAQLASVEQEPRPLNAPEALGHAEDAGDLSSQES